MKKLLVYLIFTYFNLPVIQAQQPTLVSNLQQSKATNDLLSKELNGYIYYQGYNSTTGAELYKTEGTTSTLVKDILPGSGVALHQMGPVLNNKLFFSAFDGVNGVELWSTDGTEAGTVMVKDIAVGAESAYPQNFTLAGSSLYFTTNEGEAINLYKTDGTSAGTTLVANLQMNYAGRPVFTHFTAVGARLCYFKTDYSTYRELWSSDGTTASLVKSFQYTFMYDTEVFNNKLYFVANDGISGREVWSTDGTLANTTLFVDLSPGSESSYIEYISKCGPNLLFNWGGALFISNGNSAPLTQIKNLQNYPYYFFNNGNITYFFLSNINQREIWRTDGTTNGTFKILDYQFSGHSNDDVSYIDLNSTTTIFTVNSFEHNGQELWKTDGTVAGTFFVKDINPGLQGSFIRNFQKLGASVLMTARTLTEGVEIWKTDGLNTVQVTNTLPDDEDSNPQDLQEFNNYLLFTAENSNAVDRNLYAINSTSSLPSYLSGTNSHEFYPFVNKIYFAGNNTDSELYATDGTNGGTALVKNINTTGSSSPKGFVGMGSYLYFNATTPAVGAELWKTDGTAANTTLVSDLLTGANSSNPRNITNLNSNILFFADNSFAVTDLWKSDGTFAGTTKIIASGFFNPFDESAGLTLYGSHVYFSFNTSLFSSNQELYRTDGNTYSLVKEIRPGTNGSNPNKLFVLGATMFFVANDGTHGPELWKTDGTTVNTLMVKDINPGGAGSSISNMYNHNGVLYFTAITSQGRELWKSDGTETGTILVKDINPFGNADPSNFCTVNNWLFFAAEDGLHKREIWKTDGTATGTVLVYDFFADKSDNLNSTDPTFLTFYNNAIYFAGTDGLPYGRELYKIAPCLTSPLYNHFASSTSHAINTIETSPFFSILPKNTYNYFSEKSILLNPGFSMSALPGKENVFRAEIRTCD